MDPARVALFYLLLLLFSPMASAMPADGFPPAQNTESLPPVSPSTNEGLYSPAAPEAHDLILSFQSLPGGGSVCRFSELSPLDVQRFKDSILVPGLVGDEVGAGTQPNTDRDTISDNNVLVVPNPLDEETAFKKQIPNQILEPGELAPLQNQRIKGPFAFGLSLYDSLRAAKCTPEGPCAVQGESLQYRNSGEGITGNVKDMWSALFKDDNSVNEQFSPEEADFLQAQVQSQQISSPEGEAALQGIVYSRSKDPDVMNHIAIDNTFQAGILTNCADGRCVLTLYSMFDKYFNSWFSGEMVIGTFGPTLWGQFRKMLTKTKRYSLLSGSVTDKLNPAKIWENRRISSFLDDYTASIHAGTPMAPSEFFSKYKFGPKDFQIGGATVLDNLKRAGLRDQDAADTVSKLFAERKIISLGSSSKIEDEVFGPEGIFSKITDVEKRKQLFTFWSTFKQYTDVAETMRGRLETDFLAGRINKADYGRGILAIEKDYDDAWKIDLFEETRTGLDGVPGWNEFTFKNNVGQSINWKYDVDKYYKDAAEQFIKTGDFTKFGPGVPVPDLKLVKGYTDPVTGVATLFQNPRTGEVYQGFQLFKFNTESLGAAIDPGKIGTSDYKDVLVQLSDGRVVPAIPASITDIQADISHGITPRIVVKGGNLPVQPPIIDPKKPVTNANINWDKVNSGLDLGIMTPNTFADRLLSGNVAPGKIKNAKRATDSIFNSMVIRDWGKGPYTNLLSRSLQNQEKLIGNYFNIVNPNVLENGLGWTAKMYGYWWMTRGFGSDKFSIYQLPEEWHEVSFEPGETEFYNDAYIDFFANEGSDSGDLFQKVISNFPAPIILDSVVEDYEPLNTIWNSFTGGTDRSSPENLAMFLFGPQSCPECAAVVTSPSAERFDVQFSSTDSTNTFFLEHPKTKDAKEKGQLLVSFSHRTNINGEMAGEELTEINLVKAREEGETCEQVMDDLFIYGVASRVFGAEKVGAVAALAENLSYITGGLMGTLFSGAQQLVLAPQMNECVDDKEGYFASLFVPNREEEDRPGKSDELQKSVTEDALNGIREFANQVDTKRTGQSLTDNVLKESTAQVRELVDEAQEDDVAEAELRITGSSSGYLRSEEVMYFWVGGGSLVEPTKYLTDGMTVLTTEDGHTLTLDNEEGTLTVDGLEVIGEDKEDHVRLTNKNLSIPAMEVPQRLNGFLLGDSNSLLLTMNVRGETLVQDPALLDCLQSAVLEQSGVGLQSNNLGDAFGKGQTVTTDAFPSISIDTINNRIQLGGQVPQTAYGAGASIQLYGNRRVVVTGAAFPEAGDFQSASWENGTVVYKPQSNELLIWLRHHAQAVVSDEDVKGFHGDLTTTPNPTTQCEEPAVSLSVETDPNSPAAKLKGDNLTAGLETNGPFQVFDTPTKQFILYSKLVDGECTDFFKVINKETGEVYDQEITGITQGEDGNIQIVTADGQTHSLQFSDENGKPVLTYDGKSELLQSASGKGGSFYYDPDKGLYYAENAQLIPLNDNFRNQGIGFQANPDGSVSGKAAENVFNINTGQGTEGLFNIPSIPEDWAGAGLILLILIGSVLGLYVDSRKKKETLHPNGRSTAV
ncbi:MAG: hypothetical protein AABW68_03155 [archaeon]